MSWLSRIFPGVFFALDDGPLPLAVLEAGIGRWIEARKAAPRA